MTGQPGQAPGVVEVRLSGAPDDIEAVSALLAAATGGGERVEIIRRSGWRVNRYDLGVRRYLKVRVVRGGRS